MAHALGRGNDGKKLVLRQLRSMFLRRGTRVRGIATSRGFHWEMVKSAPVGSTTFTPCRHAGSRWKGRMALAARTSSAAPRESGPGFAAFQQDLMSVLKGSGTLDTLKAHHPTKLPPLVADPAHKPLMS